MINPHPVAFSFFIQLSSKVLCFLGPAEFQPKMMSCWREVKLGKSPTATGRNRKQYLCFLRQEQYPHRICIYIYILSVCLSVYLSIHPFFCLSVCRSIYIYIYIIYKGKKKECEGMLSHKVSFAQAVIRHIHLIKIGPYSSDEQGREMSDFGGERSVINRWWYKGHGGYVWSG